MTSSSYKTLLTWTKNAKGDVSHYTRTPSFIFYSWVYSHTNYAFYFEDMGEINGIQIPFNIRIHTPTQLQTMVQFGHNGAIYVNATFGTNDMKY
jgi:hypothetical protein